MAYKNIEQDFSFADIAVQKFADKNRSMLFLRQVNNTIDWQPVQDLLFKYYETGKTKKGERAYPPLFLFKCFLLQNSKYLPLSVISSMHTPDKIQTTYADKGYLPSGMPTPTALL